MKTANTIYDNIIGGKIDPTNEVYIIIIFFLFSDIVLRN